MLIWAALLSQSAGAVLTIKITQGMEGAQPIAVVPFGWAGSGPPPEGIAEIVADNLARTGRFAPIPFVDLPSRPTDVSSVNFRDWRLLGTGNLVIGALVPRGPGRYAVEFRLFDVFRGRQISGYQLEGSTEELRRLAHQVSDIVYEELTGERGAFDTRIAYVTQGPGPGGESSYALNIADSDGFNAHTILETSQPVLSPAWSPDGNRLAYVSFERDRSRIFVQDLATGRRREMAGFPGINGAPAFSPDGTRLAMALSKDGNLEIYVMYLKNERLLRLTNNNAIDTEPAWSPDGRSLLFTSDRGGRPQIYRQSATGGRAERLTFEGRYNARASYAPDASKITFVHGTKGAGFKIAILDLENRAIDILTETTLDESPSFAPNGSMIIYATTDRDGAALAAVSVDGRMRQRLAVEDVQVREPAWSPFRAR